jgi:flagellar basal-body rod modification protein FlgD
MTVTAPTATPPIDVSAITAPKEQTIATKGNDTLDKQAFLMLLVAQLRNQDPSNPVDSAQLMTQTNQLAQTEALQDLVKTQQEAFALNMRLAASDLVGKNVAWTDADGAVQHGVVEFVSYAGPVPTVRVGGIDLPLDAVAAVTQAPKAASLVEEAEGRLETPDPDDESPAVEPVETPDPTDPAES